MTYRPVNNARTHRHADQPERQPFSPESGTVGTPLQGCESLAEGLDSMKRQPRPEPIDTRLVFRVYAWITIVAGLLVCSWRSAGQYPASSRHPAGPVPRSAGGSGQHRPPRPHQPRHDIARNGEPRARAHHQERWGGLRSSGAARSQQPSMSARRRSRRTLVTCSPSCRSRVAARPRPRL
jgi:hypothetical protein